MKKILSLIAAFALAAFTFTSCEDVPAPYDDPSHNNKKEKVETKGSGTKDDPYNVAAADSICATLEKSSTSASYLSDEVYVKGKVSSIVDTAFNAKFQNITYYISDDGTENGTKLEVYRGFGLGGAKFNSLDDIKVGDDVIVCGQLQNWLGTYEFTSGAYLYSLNGKVAEGGGGTVEGATGDGSKDKPFNVAGVINEAGKLQTGASSSSKVYFSGVITEIVECSAEFGNATFYIADDASATNTFYVYRCLGPGNNRITDENLLKVGDKVTIYGTLTNYKGTLETKQNDAYIYSLNGKVEEGGTGDDTGGTTGGGSSEGISFDGSTLTLTNSAYTVGATTTTIDLSAQGWEEASPVTSATFPDGATVTFDKGTSTATPKFYEKTKGVRCYSNNTLVIKGKSNIAKIVMTCDVYNNQNCVGNTTATVSFDGSTVSYVNFTHNTQSQNVQLRVQTITIYYAQ